MPRRNLGGGRDAEIGKKLIRGDRLEGDRDIILVAELEEVSHQLLFCHEPGAEKQHQVV